MKTAGIVTIHMINNYGALEQAYALNKYLRLNGIDAKTIDFRTYRVEESYQLFHPIHSVMDIARNTQVILYLRKLKRRNDRFHQFLKENVPMTEETYYSNTELEKADLNFDYFICGSDQKRAIDEAVRGNNQLTRPCEKHLERDRFLDNYKRGGFVKALKSVSLYKKVKRARMLMKLKSPLKRVNN